MLEDVEEDGRNINLLLKTVGPATRINGARNPVVTWPSPHRSDLQRSPPPLGVKR
jgi:hypothetical protein